ncbi:hypothetical protein H9M94_01255 [Mycoplasma sp. Pen4]|uniref:hypothetical protein n=1 Tax=Mycoplasma sp. Pen4 TaxID=640330 RepID=UPI0016546BE7|nr:hypothetical protein [Mycoplasma sp. Pen4]QNM93885.1 hypothetical protein H9M94_01255 [Mycoplasma sp. Pen4]
MATTTNKKTTKKKKTTTTTKRKTKKSAPLEMDANLGTLSDKRFTKLIDNIILENEQDKMIVKKYRTNKLAYILAIIVIILIIAAISILIVGLVDNWFGTTVESTTT